MSAKRKVVAWRSLPARLPLTFTGVVWLLLDRFQAAAWIHGIVWTLVLILWIGSWLAMWHEEPVDLWENKP